MQNYLVRQGNASNNGCQEAVEIHNEEQRNTAVVEIFDREQKASVAVEVDNQEEMAPVIVELEEKESVPITYDNTNDLSEEQMEEKVNLCDTSQVLPERESSSDETSDKMEEDVKEVTPII